MSFPKKSTRKITVNGQTYLWMVRRIGWGKLSLTVQHPATKELFQTKLDALSPKLDDYGDRTVSASVLPSQVKEFILTRFVQP